MQQRLELPPTQRQPGQVSAAAAAAGCRQVANQAQNWLLVLAACMQTSTPNTQRHQSTWTFAAAFYRAICMTS
jgi:hypothetical protein